MITTQALADAAQAQWLWKSPQLLSIAVVVVRFMVEHDGAHFTDEVDLSFVRDEDKALIGNVWLPLATRGLLSKTGEWRQSVKPQSKCRIVWQYCVASYPLAREFLRRQGKPPEERQQVFL